MAEKKILGASFILKNSGPVKLNTSTENAVPKSTSENKPALRASFSFNKTTVAIDKTKASDDNVDNNNNNLNTSGNGKSMNKEETSKENTLINSNNNENSWKSPNPLHTSLLMQENRLSSSGIKIEDIRVSDEEWKEYLRNSHEEDKAVDERQQWKEKVAADHKEKIRIQREKQFQNARNEIFANKENLPTFKSAFIPKTKMMKSKEGWILPPLDNLFSPSSISQSTYLVPPPKKIQHLYCSNKLNNDNFIRLSTAKDISVKEIVEIQQNPIVYNQLTEADSLCSSQFLTASVRAPRLIEKKFNEIADNLPSPDSSLTQSTVLKRELYIGNLREMADDIDRLINNYIDRPEIVGPLLSLKDRINATLDLYHLSIGQEESSFISINNEEGNNNNNNNNNNSNNDNTIIIEEKNEEEESDSDINEIQDLFGEEIHISQVEIKEVGVEYEAYGINYLDDEIKEEKKVSKKNIIKIDDKIGHFLRELENEKDEESDEEDLWQYFISPIPEESKTKSCPIDPTLLYTNFTNRPQDPFEISYAPMEILNAPQQSFPVQQIEIGLSENQFIETGDDCPLCYDLAPLTTLSCGHQFCKLCLHNYLWLNRIQEAKVLNITCPTSGCELTFEDELIKSCVSEEEFARYQQLVFLASLTDNPNVRYCQEPGCEGVIVADPNSESFPTIQCEKCEKKYCFDCMKDAHAPKTCQEFEEESNMEVTLDAIFHNLFIRPCPRCRIPIEKNEGCNHMNCVQCGFHFCWLCNKEIKGYAHFSEVGPCNSKGFYTLTLEEQIEIWESVHKLRYTPEGPRPLINANNNNNNVNNNNNNNNNNNINNNNVNNNNNNNNNNNVNLANDYYHINTEIPLQGPRGDILHPIQVDEQPQINVSQLPPKKSKFKSAKKFGLYAVGIGAGAVVLGIALPVLAVGGAVYGTYHIVNRRKNKINANRT